jgi:hypothetical protein
MNQRLSQKNLKPCRPAGGHKGTPRRSARQNNLHHNPLRKEALGQAPRAPSLINCNSNLCLDSWFLALGSGFSSHKYLIY